MFENHARCNWHLPALRSTSPHTPARRRTLQTQSVGFSHVLSYQNRKLRNGAKPKNPALRVPLRHTKDLARPTVHRFAKSARKRPEAGKKFRTCGRKNSIVLIPATNALLRRASRRRFPRAPRSSPVRSRLGGAAGAIRRQIQEWWTSRFVGLR